MRAIILAGGKGRRLHPISSVLPKPLVPLGNKPILEVIIRQLKENGIGEITLAVGHMSDLIKAVFGDGKRLGVKIDYSKQNKVLGTAGPIKLIPNLKGDFLVMNGDVLTTLNFKKMIKFHKKNKADATVGIYERNEKIQLGILEVKKGKVTKYIEKPEYTYKVSSGVYVVNENVLSLLKYNQFCDFPTFITRLIKKRKKVLAFPFNDYWLDLGRPDDYFKAFELFEKNPNIFIPKLKKRNPK